jgi:hypothetical protein
LGLFVWRGGQDEDLEGSKDLLVDKRHWNSYPLSFILVISIESTIFTTCYRSSLMVVRQLTNNYLRTPVAIHKRAIHINAVTTRCSGPQNARSKPRQLGQFNDHRPRTSHCSWAKEPRGGLCV